MNPNETIITSLVLETTRDFPAARRALHLRALAALVSSDGLAIDLTHLAADLEDADRRQGQLILNLATRGGNA